MELPLRVVLDGAKYSWESHIFRNTGWQIRPQALDSNDMDLDLRCVTLSPLGSLLVSSVRDSEDVAWSHQRRKRWPRGVEALGRGAGQHAPSAERSARHTMHSANGAPLVAFWGVGQEVSPQSRCLPRLLEERTQAESSDTELRRRN